MPAIVSLNDLLRLMVWQYLARRRRYALSLPPLSWQLRIVQVMRNSPC